MFRDQAALFDQAAQERKSEKDYINSCARNFIFQLEIVKLDIVRNISVIAFSEQEAVDTLIKQMPPEWKKEHWNIPTIDSRNRVDLISPNALEHYNKIIAKPIQQPKRK